MLEKFGSLDKTTTTVSIAEKEMKISQTFSSDGTSRTEVNGRDVSLLIRNEKITGNIGIVSDNRSVRDL
jgi:cytidylate kinase